MIHKIRNDSYAYFISLTLKKSQLGLIFKNGGIIKYLNLFEHFALSKHLPMDYICHVAGIPKSSLF